MLMTRNEFLRALEEVLQLDAGTLKTGLALANIPEWDSLGVVDFQGLVDESLGKDLAPERINACNTIDDLLALVADKLAD
jgi:acyl carrier protein